MLVGAAPSTGGGSRAPLRALPSVLAARVGGPTHGDRDSEPATVGVSGGASVRLLAESGVNNAIINRRGGSQSLRRGAHASSPLIALNPSGGLYYYTMILWFYGTMVLIIMHGNSAGGLLISPLPLRIRARICAHLQCTRSCSHSSGRFSRYGAACSSAMRQSPR